MLIFYGIKKTKQIFTKIFLNTNGSSQIVQVIKYEVSKRSLEKSMFSFFIGNS